MSANDIRELENLDRIGKEDGGDLYLVNGNMLPLSMAGAYAQKDAGLQRKPMKKFWKWRNSAAAGTAPEARTLFLNGTIAEESWLTTTSREACFAMSLKRGRESPYGSTLPEAMRGGPRRYTHADGVQGDVPFKIDASPPPPHR